MEFSKDRKIMQLQGLHMLQLELSSAKHHCIPITVGATSQV